MTNPLVLPIPVFDLNKIGEVVAEKLEGAWEDEFYQVFDEDLNIYHKKLRTTHPLFLLLNSILEAENPKAKAMILVEL